MFLNSGNKIWWLKIIGMIPFNVNLSIGITITHSKKKSAIHGFQIFNILLRLYTCTRKKEVKEEKEREGE